MLTPHPINVSDPTTSTATGSAAGARVPAGPGPREVLTLDRVSAQLGGRPVLREVCVGVRAGELTGLIGPNGAGKTTLLRAMLGFQPLSGGTVTVHRSPPCARRSGRRGTGRRGAGPMIGYVPQKVQLDPDIPVRARDLVALGLDGHRYGLPRTSRVQRARVQRALAAVDAEHLADARVGLLSGGEQQRILIAHALIGRPSVLLLDEPLTNLDPASAYHVVKLLAAIAADHQIAVVVSAHEMNTLLPVLDQVIYLANGRAAHGPTERVIRADVLTRLYGQPVEVLRVGNRVLVITGEHIDGADATTGPTPTCQA